MLLRTISFFLIALLSSPKTGAQQSETAPAEKPPAKAAPVKTPQPPEAPPKFTLDPGRADSMVLLEAPTKIGLGVQICSVTEAPGISIDPASPVLSIDQALFRPGWIEIGYQPAGQACGKKLLSFRLFPSRRQQWMPPWEALTLWFDSGVAELKSGGIQDFLLVSVAGGKVTGMVSCPEKRSCTLEPGETFLEELASASDKAHFLTWPAEIPLRVGEPLPTVIGPQGAVVDPRNFALRNREVVFGHPLIEPLKLDATEDRRVVPSRFSGAIEQVTCDNAECRVTDEGILLFQIDPAAPAVKVSYALKSHHLRKIGTRLVSSESVSLKLERCPLRIPREVPLLAEGNNHRYYLKLPRECTSADAADLHIETRPPTRAYVRSEPAAGDPGVRLFEVVFDRVPSGVDRIALSLFERVGRLRRLGSVRIPVASGYSPVQIRFSVAGVGRIDHVPSNVPAALRFGTADPRWLRCFSVEARPGFYQVTREKNGWSVLGEDGVTGNVPLRFAYRPGEIQSFTGKSGEQAPPLATFDSESVYPVRSVNVPLSLLSGAAPESGFIQVACGRPGHERNIEIGKLARISYEERESCRIVFHRERIPRSAGLQRLRVKAGDFNQIIALSHGGDSLTVAIPTGERKEYDRLTVTISHDMQSGHYAEQSRQSLGEEARYRILLSDSWWRIGATTAMPTGMFRFGAASVEGTIPLSAGALGRMTYIQRDGRDFPLGLEVGVFGTNLSGQPDFSIVAGLGLSIPVLNPDTSLQASFNIHAWLELAPTRSSRDESPWAFLFGPSFTVGRLSTTF